MSTLQLILPCKPWGAYLGVFGMKDEKRSWFPQKFGIVFLLVSKIHILISVIKVYSSVPCVKVKFKLFFIFV